MARPRTTQHGDDRSQSPDRGKLDADPRREPNGSQVAPDEDAEPAIIPDLIRRAVTLGLSSFFTTEEAIRRAVNDTLPKDWVDFAVDQSERTREDLLKGIAEEFGEAIQNLEFAKLAEQLLEGRTIEINAQVRLSPRDEDAVARAPRVRSRTKTRVVNDEPERTPAPGNEPEEEGQETDDG